MGLWKRLQAARVRLGIAGLVIALVAGIVAAAYFAVVFPAWTGLPPGTLDTQGHEQPHAKTLWDWLDLLLVPLVLAVGGYFLTRSENREARVVRALRQNIESARRMIVQVAAKDRAEGEPGKHDSDQVSETWTARVARALKWRPRRRAL